MDLKKRVGERMKMLREGYGISQKDLAKAIQTNQSAITRYENGICEPNLQTLLDYAVYFKVSIDWIFGRTESRMEGTRLADLNEEIVEGSPLYEKMREVITKIVNEQKK